MKNVVGRLLAFIMVVATVGGVVAMFVNNLVHYNMKKEIEKNNQEVSKDASEDETDQSQNLLIDFSVIFPDKNEKEEILSGNFENLKDLLEAGMSNLGLEFEEENGSVITSVDSIENEKDGKWNIYINGALLQAPLNSVKVNDNDIVKIMWDKQ